jgi:hypothetical protein
MRAVSAFGEPWTRGAMSLPLWAVALVLATLAPLSAKLLAGWFERRSRMRSRHLLGIRAEGSGVASDRSSTAADSREHDTRTAIDEGAATD